MAKEIFLQLDSRALALMQTRPMLSQEDGKGVGLRNQRLQVRVLPGSYALLLQLTCASTRRRALRQVVKSYATICKGGDCLRFVLPLAYINAV